MNQEGTKGGLDACFRFEHCPHNPSGFQLSSERRSYAKDSSRIELGMWQTGNPCDNSGDVQEISGRYPDFPAKRDQDQICKAVC